MGSGVPALSTSDVTWWPVARRASTTASFVAAIVAVVLLIAYFVFQVVAQASLFEWIGDRIDNFTDEQNGAALTAAVRMTSGVRPLL